ncbi:Abi family protein [Janibacter sp. G368]|uniref:Abi family protein n=1 Tax=Janibacter sp. G368 TaxID=3420441 RepID=UPI003D01429E
MAQQVVKPFTTIGKQVELLRARGMMLDRDEAERWLTVVGYYRLSGYWYPYRALNTGVRGDQFVQDARFDDVVRLYEFDRKLRTQIHDGRAHRGGSAEQGQLPHRGARPIGL